MDHLPISANRLTVLIAPLDWGLGHASRCIPIIQTLVNKGHKVIIATDGLQLSLLQKEFPGLQYLTLPGYGVTYSKRNLPINIIVQIRKIARAISKETTWLRNAITSYNIDWVISDNRYGLYSNKIPCTFITHQLLVKAPWYGKLAEPFIQKRLFKFINQFTECWVPDFPGKNNSLSGSLGHPAKMPLVPVRYIGWLTRFAGKMPAKFEKGKTLILLSGPEPQRSILEEKLVSQLQQESGKFILARGLPNTSGKLWLPENTSVANHLSAADMLQAMNECEYVISRSGYSTLMDAFTLFKKCILVPTPGQTEQEYLGDTLAKNKVALVYKQHQFNLKKALATAAAFEFNTSTIISENLLEPAIDQFIEQQFIKPGRTD